MGRGGKHAKPKENHCFSIRIAKPKESHFSRKTLCTIKLSRKAFPLEKSYGLGKLTSRIGIKIKNRHRAIGDAEATLKLFNLIREKLSENDIREYIKECE